MALSDHTQQNRTPSPNRPRSPIAEATPKRKRDEILQSDSALVTIDTPTSSKHFHAPGSSSPSGRVAEKFRDLKIQKERTTIPRSRKRLKRNPGVAKTTSLGGYDHLASSEQNTPAQHGNGDQAIDEVGETPDCRTRMKSSSPISNSHSEGPQRAQELLAAPEHDQEHNSPLLSLTPETPLSSPPNAEDIIDRSVSPLPSRNDLTSDQAALTWQDDEITGHELDPGGDDDGEGINGIGFKPTPAIAFSREQKRKQQVNQWKVREAREARERRFERRRGAPDIVDRGQDNTCASERRMVRFVGVG